MRSLLDEQGHPYTEVFEVEDLHEGGKLKVLKTLKDQSNPKLEELFEQERKILAELKHPSIPKYEDAFSIAISHPTHRELPCLVMQLIEGENLEHWLSRNQRLTDESIALNWFAQITRVLDYVHQKHFFHRDIKPSNIIRQPNGQLILIDFGTARRLTQTVINGRPVTQVYTAGYTAPEQLDGRAVPQSDFYALGRTFLHLLTGRHPSDLDTQYWDTMTEFSPSDRFRNLINRCLNHDYQQRPSNAKAILSEIETMQSRSTIAPPDQNTVQPIYQPRLSEVKPRFVKWAGVAITALLIVLLVNYCSPSIVPNTPLIPPIATKLVRAEELISYGQRTISEDRTAELGTTFQDLKNQGIAELAQGNFERAIKIFDGIREAYGNRRNESFPNKADALKAFKDPEVLIYRNNAEARRRNKQDKSPIYTIALAAPLNLEDVDVSRQMLFGVAQMQDQVVNRKDPKLNLEVAIANDRGNTEQAKAIAEFLTQRGIDGRPVLAVVGHYTSPVTCAALGIYSEAKLVVVSPTSTVTNMRLDSDCKDTQGVFFRTTSSTAIEAETLLYGLNTQVSNSKRIALFYNKQEKFSQDLAAQFQRLLDKSHIDYIPFNLAEDSFNPEESLKQAENVDALAIFADGQTNNSSAFDRAVQVLRLNQGQKLVLAANTFYNGKLLGELDTLGQRIGFKKLESRMLVAADWYSELPGAEAFREDIKNYWAGDLNQRTALAYEAVQALVEVFRSPNFNRNEIKQKLTDLDIDSGILQNRKIRFDRYTGDRKDSVRVILTTVYGDKGMRFKQL